MILSFTGHRPHKLDYRGISGYVESNPLRLWIKDQVKKQILELKPLYAISGMAIGYDQDAASVCVELKVPFVAAVPFLGQESKWPIESQRKYQEMLSQAYEVVYVNDGPYASWKLISRNHYMIDHSNAVSALWDGTSGGTSSTVMYANGLNRDIYRIDPNEFRKK